MEGMEIYTVELYLKVRLACADGMTRKIASVAQRRCAVLRV